jgi:hypothetical protein
MLLHSAMIRRNLNFGAIDPLYRANLSNDQDQYDQVETAAGWWPQDRL